MNSKISFGIISLFEDIPRINKIIQSIENQKIYDYEIVICGGHEDSIANEFSNHKIKLVDFNEKEVCSWITKKKNLVFKNMKYDIIVLIHDYIYFNKGWHDGLMRYIKEDNNWSALCNKILKMNGKRWRLDWTGHQYWTPYSEPCAYVSGSYFVTKRSIMEKCLFDERLSYNQAEDVEWSNRINKIAPIKFNPYSSCSLLKIHRENEDCL